MTQPSGGADSLRAELPKWSNSQDSWIRAIVTDVLQTRVQCADAAIDRYLRLLLAEKGLSDGPVEAVPHIEEKQLAGNQLDPVRIDSLRVGDGVNAIKAGAQIDFALGVTVIFGENGSGKSGFVRLLKRAAGVRTAEDILHNVRGAPRPTPSASFSVTIGASSTPVEWKNEFGIVPLNRASIFDARGARLHVEEDLSYVYTPGELLLFPAVQNGIERVRTTLDREITARTPGTNTLLTSFDRACTIYATIETLGAATDVGPIRKYAALPDHADAAIESLKSEIDVLTSTNIQTELRRARDRATVVQALKTAVDAGMAFDVSKYAALIEACNVATRRRDEAGSKAFDGLEIPGALTEVWRAFISAGEEYLRAHATEGYPHAVDSCVYCRQPLGAKAIELIQKYRDFSNNDIKTALDKAERDVREHTESVAALAIDVLQQQHATEASSEDDVLAPLMPLLERMRKLAASVASRTAIAWPEMNLDLAAAEKIVSAESKLLAGLILDLQSSVEQRQETLKRKRTDLTDLLGRKTTNDLLPQIERRVSDAKWVSQASLVRNGFTTALRSLTEAAKEASEELLNKGFEKRFQEECRRLRAPSVALNFPGRQGQVTRRKTVAAYKPSQILSEGEQKALALADFFAEVTAVPASSPVIFDDPITSMDYRRIHEVCDRIVALSREHQTIVFTHNIWFAAELLAKADKKSCRYFDIRSEGGDSGVLSAANHPRVDTAAQVSNRVKQLIEGAGKVQGEVKAALVEKGYEVLRGFCEIIVEHEMLKGVVQRYAPNIMMTKVEKINVDKLREGMSVVMTVFEKACRYIASHSQPIETQGIRPTLDELKADYEAVLKARDPHKD